MTGQHRKGVTVTFDANLPAVRKYIDDAVAIAINQAAGAIRAVREWCDTQKPCAIGKGCVRCAVRAEVVEEVRNLLPPVPEAAEEVSSGHASDEGPGVPGLTPK